MKTPDGLFQSAAIEKVMDRLWRYHQNLPESEPLAITDDEVYEFASMTVFVTKFPNGAPATQQEAEARIIWDLRAGGVKFLGHPIVVLS